MEKKKDNAVSIAICFGFFAMLFVVGLGLGMVATKSPKETKPNLDINVDYQVINYSQSIRDVGDTENQDTTINFVTPSGEHRYVVVTNEIESRYSNFGKLVSKDSQLMFVGSDYHDLKDIVAGTPIAYARYNILNDDKSHINITINEDAEIRNFTLFTKE